MVNSSDRLFMELLLHVLVVAVVLIYRAIRSYEAAPETTLKDAAGFSSSALNVLQARL